ncbi:MAG: caspase family protein [Chloroflexales bacterium]
MNQMTLADAARTVLLAVAPLIAGGTTATTEEALARDWGAVETRFKRELAAAERAELVRAARVIETRLAGQSKAARALDYFRTDPQDTEAQHIVEGQIVEVFKPAPDDLIALVRLIITIQPALRADAGRAVLPSDLSVDGVHFSYGHALVIGLGAYANQKLNVAGDTAANDARALATLLRNPRLAAYPEDHVHVLVDAKATRDHILDALEELAHRVDGGTALIFFAGHGEPLGDSYALLPYDADLSRLAETALPAELFQRRVAKVRQHAGQLVVLLNCCHAGDVSDEVLSPSAGGPSGAAPPPAFYQPLATGGGQIVISASRPTQRAGARAHGDTQHTVFGEHLLAALRGRAPGAGVGIGALELFAYLRARVPADAQHIIDHWQPLAQEPLLYAAQLDGDFAVALRPGWQGGGADSDLAQQVRRLADLELEAGCAEAVAPALVEEREQLLRALVW